MTKRREFPSSVKKAVIKRAGATGMLICEQCGGFARRFQIDHIIADAHGGEPVIENAQLICEACYAVKNSKDTTIAAKLKRVENQHLGVRPTPTMQSRGFSPPAPKDRTTSKVFARRSLYQKA